MSTRVGETRKEKNGERLNKKIRNPRECFKTYCIERVHLLLFGVFYFIWGGGGGGKTL